jgi:hypothetical protein
VIALRCCYGKHEKILQIGQSFSASPARGSDHHTANLRQNSLRFTRYPPGIGGGSAPIRIITLTYLTQRQTACKYHDLPRRLELRLL